MKGKKAKSLANCIVRGHNGRKSVWVRHEYFGHLCEVTFVDEHVTMEFVRSVRAALQAMAAMETEQEEKTP